MRSNGPPAQPYEKDNSLGILDWVFGLPDLLTIEFWYLMGGILLLIGVVWIIYQMSRPIARFMNGVAKP